MSAETRFRVKPTFPLDKALIRKYRARRIWRSPLTWSVLAGTAILGLLRGFTPGFAAVAGIAVGGLLSFWKTRSPRIEVDAVQEIIAESNRQQDMELNRIIDVLEEGGHPQYALSLGKFLLLKRHIEEALHADGQLNDQKQQIEVLVDGICRQVCNQLTRLTQLRQNLGSAITSTNPQRLDDLDRHVDESHRRIMKAYGVMYETAENLDTIVHPGKTQQQSVLQSEAEQMDRLIENLQEENEVAQRVHERMKDVPT